MALFAAFGQPGRQHGGGALLWELLLLAGTLGLFPAVGTDEGPQERDTGEGYGEGGLDGGHDDGCDGGEGHV